MSTEDNKALARRFYEELWNRKNLAVANELIAATYVFHMPGSPPGIRPGPEGFTQFVSVFFPAFPDVHVTIEDQMAEGERVTTRWTSMGHTQEICWASLPRASRSPSRGSALTALRTARLSKVGTTLTNWACCNNLALFLQWDRLVDSIVVRPPRPRPFPC